MLLGWVRELSRTAAVPQKLTGPVREEVDALLALICRDPEEEETGKAAGAGQDGKAAEGGMQQNRPGQDPAGQAGPPSPMALDRSDVEMKEEQRLHSS